MKHKIGVFGSAIGGDVKLVEKAKELGKALGEQGVVVITGAGSGLPYLVAREAARRGAEIWGFASTVSLEQHEKEYPDHNRKMYKKLTMVPKNYDWIEDDMASKKYRNISSTYNCDAGIIISGRWGSLNEFTNLIDMGKLVGVLSGTGGVADELENLVKKIRKKGSGRVIFSQSPSKLVLELINEISK